MLKRVLASLSILLLLASNDPPLRAQAKSDASSIGTSYDLVVYGGTAGGVITAVAAAREGLTVALLEPGGISAEWSPAGSAGPTTAARKSSAAIRSSSSSGSARSTAAPIEWHFEPHVAEAVFEDLVKEAGVRVFLGHRLREKSGVAEDRNARHRRS